MSQALCHQCGDRLFTEQGHSSHGTSHAPFASNKYWQGQWEKERAGGGMEWTEPAGLESAQTQNGNQNAAPDYLKHTNLCKASMKRTEGWQQDGQDGQPTGKCKVRKELQLRNLTSTRARTSPHAMFPVSGLPGVQVLPLKGWVYCFCLFVCFAVCFYPPSLLESGSCSVAP